MIIKVGIWGMALLVGWLAVLAGVMRVSDAAPAALIVAPGPAVMAALPEDTAILTRGPLGVTVTSPRPDLAARLYQAGALLVLPAGLMGCVPRSDARS